MAEAKTIAQFTEKAQLAGADVVRCPDLDAAIDYLQSLIRGPLVLPSFPSAERLELAKRLSSEGCQVLNDRLRESAAEAAAGLTGANFAIAETGTVVLESTPEEIRLASTLPPVHFVLLDPRKIIADSQEAPPILRRFHQQQERNYLAYITGPSRTADIERVLTIGVHGPKELHILLIEGLSDDPMEQ